MTETPILLDDLDLIRTTLASVLNYLQAQDVANAQVNLADSVNYRPLTREVTSTLERVNGVLSDALLVEHLAQDEDEDEAFPSSEEMDEAMSEIAEMGGDEGAEIASEAR